MFQTFSQGVAALLTILMLGSHVQADDLQGKVVGVLDGDTIEVLDAAKKPRRIRLAEIDAPEKAQAFGQRSKQALSDLCFAKQARVRIVDQDRYGRAVGRVFCEGQDANLSQVRQGMAWAYERYAKDPAILAAEREARAARRGLWADPNPVPPWQWRRQR